jgi:hypothetical protein
MGVNDVLVIQHARVADINMLVLWWGWYEEEPTGAKVREEGTLFRSRQCLHEGLEGGWLSKSRVSTR